MAHCMERDNCRVYTPSLIKNTEKNKLNEKNRNIQYLRVGVCQIFLYNLGNTAALNVDSERI